MLSDHEQRALEELERSYATGTAEPVTPGWPPGRAVGRTGRQPGVLVVGVLGCLSIAVAGAGVPAAGLAMATATAIGWLFWRIWSHRTDGGGIAASLSLGVGCGQSGPRRRPGESIRQYLRWLAEAQ